MKIAYILSSLRNKGPIKVVKIMVDEFVKNHHSVKVFYFDDVYDDILKFNCKTEKIFFWRKRDFKGYDVVHTHGIRPDLYARFFLVSRQIVVTTMHNYMREDLKYHYGIFRSALISKLWCFAIQKHDLIITLSKHAQQYYSNTLNHNNINYCYNAMANVEPVIIDYQDPLINKVLTFISNEHVTLGCVGALIARKGFEQILSALANFQNVKLIIVGHGHEYYNLLRVAKNLKVYDRCLFLGHLSPNEVRSVIKLIDIFIVPSRSEGFSLALLEAGQAKKAVVCSDIPTFKELYSDVVTFFHLDDIDSLVDAIQKAINNKKILEKKIYEKFLKEYNVSRQYKRHIDLYKKAINCREMR